VRRLIDADPGLPTELASVLRDKVPVLNKKTEKSAQKFFNAIETNNNGNGDFML